MDGDAGPSGSEEKGAADEIEIEDEEKILEILKLKPPESRLKIAEQKAMEVLKEYKEIKAKRPKVTLKPAHTPRSMRVVKPNDENPPTLMRLKGFKRSKSV